MNRAFISLYFFIVASIVGVGWGLNAFWARLEPAPQIPVEIHALMQTLAQQLHAADGRVNAAKLANLNQQLPVAIELLNFEDLANNQFREQLQTGTLLAASSQAETLWYQRLGTSDKVLVVHIPELKTNSSPVYGILLLVFYLAIALAIYLWVWPLARAAKKLELQTHHFGADGVPAALDISPASTLYPLAQAFNQMAQRLRALIASHRDMTNAVSHELRTPLARMKFALALLPRAELDLASQRQLQSLEQDIAEMESLINALLIYAGFEQKSQTLVQTQGYMQHLYSDLELRFKRSQGRQLQWHWRDQLQGRAISCEWQLMERVLHNLIQNALRYARTQISVELGETPDSYWLAVEDDGPGVPLAERERVFDSFVRLYMESEQGDQNMSSNSLIHAASGLSTTAPIASQTNAGFGLGLAIVKRIMVWHLGQACFVAPKRFGGARVELRWPKPPA
jgi:two-component system, OmpR family, sensor kinase